jgi:Leucine-rich repeat (LRR) protein
VFGLLAVTPNAITFSNLPAGGVGTINGTQLQVPLSIPAGETLSIVGTGSDMGGNATFEIFPGAAMRIVAGASITGAGGGWRWQISGTLELVDNASVGGGMLLNTGSTLLYTGNVNKTAGSELFDGMTGAPYAGGFPGNVVVNKATGSLVDITSSLAISGSTTLLAGNIRNNSSGTLTFNGSLAISGANTRLVSGCLGGTIVLNNATNSMSGTSTEIWLGGNSTLTVNGGATLNISNGTLNLVGTGGCGSGQGQVNGGGTINYTTNGTLATGGGWTGTLDTPELPISPTPMNGKLDISGSSGGGVTVANDLRMVGDLNLGAFNLVMAVNKGIILEGAGVINATTGKIKADNLNTVTIRRGGFNSVLFVSSWIYRLVIDNPGGVNMTNPLTVGGGGLNFANTGNLIVGPTTLTLEGNGSNHVTGGAGRVDATNPSAIVSLTNNPQVDGARFLQPVTTLASGATPPCAATLNGPWLVNNLNHSSGVMGVSGGLSLAAGGTHTIAATRTLNINSFGRVTVMNGTTLANNGTLWLGGAGTLEMNGSGASLAGTAPTYSVSNAVLAYTGTGFVGNGIEFPASMPGSVLINRNSIADGIGLTNAPTSVAGSFTLQSGYFSLNSGHTLNLNGPLINGGGRFASFTADNMSINGAVTNPIQWVASPNNQLNNFLLGPSSGNIQILSPLTINNQLTMNGGRLDVTAGGLMINNSAVGALTGTGFNTGRNIVGTLTRTTLATGAYQFPVSTPGNYMPFTLTNPGAAATVSVMPDASGFSSPGPHSGGLSSVDGMAGTWQMNVLAGTVGGASTTVTLQPLIAPPSTGVVGVTTGSRTNPYANAGGSVAGPLVTSAAGSLAASGATRIFASGDGAQPPTSLAFSAITTTSFNTSFSPAVPAPSGGYIAIRRPIGAASTNPTNGMSYSVGNSIGAGTVIGVGAGTGPFASTGLTAGTGYAVDVYSFSTGFTYLTSQVLTGSVYTQPSGTTCTTGTIALPYTQTMLDRNVQINSLSITGAGVISGAGTNLAHVTPGGSFQVSYNWQTSSVGMPYCPGCVTQIYLGINGVFTDCFTPYVPLTQGATPKMTATITAPVTPGVYFMGLSGSWDYYCYPSVGFANSAATAPGAIIVGSPCLSTLSDVLSPETVPAVAFAYPTNIASATNTGATVIAANPTVWQVRVRDGAGAADPDFFPTVVTGMTINVSDPGGVLNRIALYDASGTVKLDEVAAGGTINFTALDIKGGALATAPDGGAVDFQIKVTFNTSIATANQFSFTMTNVTTYAGRSGMASVSTPVSSTAGNNNRVLPNLSNNGDIQQPPAVPFTYPMNIPYISHLGATVTGANPSVWRIRVRDGGGTPDPDNLTTVVSGLQVSLNDPNNVVKRVAIFDAGGTVNLAEQAAAPSMNFTGIDAIGGPLATAPDNGTVDFLVKVTFNTAVIDQSQFSFNVTNVATLTGRSGMSVTSVGPSSTAGNDNRIDVVATQLAFTTTPPSVLPIGLPMSPVQQVAAQDANNNLDVNWTGTVTLSNAYLAPSAVSMASGGLVNFGSLTFNAPATAQVLTATSSPALTSVVSGMFDIAQPVMTVDSSSLNFGRIPIGTFIEREIKVSATGLAGNITIVPLSSTLATLSLTGGATFSTQPTLTLVPSGTNLAPTSVFVRFAVYPPDSLTRTGLLRLTSPYASTISLPWTGVGISPNPRALAFSQSSSTATLGIPGAWASGVPQLVQVGTFRSDNVLAAMPTTATVQLFVTPLPGGNARFQVDINNTGSSTATLFKGDTGLNLSNVRIVWLNGPAQGGTTTATVTLATISGYSLISTQTTISVTVDRTLPTVTAVTPAYQGVGGAVILTGTGFAGAIKVIVGNVSQPNYRVDSPTQISVFGLTTGTVTGVVAVETNGGADSIRSGSVADAQAFEFAKPPTIASLFPVEQAAGGVVSIFGQNYTPAIKTNAPNPISVQFGSRPALVVSATNIATIFAQVGSSGASGKVTVTTVGGSTTSTQSFTFVKPPIIYDFTPKFGQLGTEISVTGANFTALSDIAAITIGGVPVDSYRVIKKGLDGTVGELVFKISHRVSGPLEILNIAGSTSSTVNFTYVDPPTITEFSPMTSATGKAVRITGTNFIQVRNVAFGGITAASFTVPSSTAIIAIVGSGTSGTLTVSNIVGTTTSTQALDFVRPPSIRSFSPLVAGAGVWVTITGANFRLDSTTVEFIGNKADSVIVDSSGTRLRARVAKGSANQGSLIVSNLAGSALASDLFRFVPPPEIREFSPEEGTTGATVTISGVAFVNVDSVTVGGVPVAEFVRENDSKLVVTLDSGARGPIRVFTLQGAATTATIFRFVYKDTLPPPRITRFTPLTGRPGDTVTIRGVNFNITNAVLFGGVTAASFRVISPSELRATLPPNATTGSVTVITPFGVTTSTIRFTFQPVVIVPQPTPLGQDSIALVQFYLNNNGGGWANLQGWLRSAMPPNLSTWTGVTVEKVDTSFRVTAVQLPTRGIAGKIPSLIAQLTALKTLDLSGNKLEGSIPIEISTIATLQELRLSNNLLTNTSSGQVIDRLDSMRRLKVLRLDGNRFVSSLPELLCKLPQLQELSLAGNQFGGRIPSCWFTMAGLQVLDLSRNNLDGALPPELGQFQSLRELSLAGNAFSGQIPQTLAASTTGTLLAARKNEPVQAALPQLTKLDLSSNRLTGEIPPTIWTLIGLQELNLSGNRLEGTLPAAIRQLTNLRMLNLSKLQLRGTLPTELSELTNVQTLTLDSNSFEGRLPSLSKSRPQEINVRWNQFTSLADLNTLSSLKTARIEGNRLTFDVLEPVVAMRSLTTLSYAPQDSLGVAIDTVGLAGQAFRYTLRTGGRANAYQWFKNGVPVEQISTTLALDNFKEADAGSYICRVTNANVPALTLWTRPLKIAFSLPTPPSKAPTLLAPANNAQNVQVPTTLVWSRLTDALNYKVELRDDSTNAVVSTFTVADTSLRVTGLNFLTRYNWRVRGANAGGNGPETTPFSFRTIAKGAVLAASTLGFGRVVVGRPIPIPSRDTLQITNLSTAPLTLVSVVPQESSSESNFTIASAVTNVALLPNQSVSVAVEFLPRSIGQKSANLAMTYLVTGGTPQTVTQAAVLTGQGGALDVEGGAFGAVLVQRGSLRALRAINRSATEVNIKNARVTNSASGAFALVSAVQDVLIKAGDTATIPMQCSSPKEQFITGEVAIDAEVGTQGNRTSERATGPLTALVRAQKEADLLYNVQLTTATVNAAPGDSIKLRLQLYHENPTTLATMRRDVFNNTTNPTFTVTAQFNKNVLALSSVKEQRAYYTGDAASTIATIRMIARWDGQSPLFVEIPCVVVNGATDVTSIRILDLQWAAIGGRDMFPTFDETTQFNAALCNAGGKRLVRQTTSVALSKASPNPVSDEVTLNYSIREQGQTTLALYDLKGIKLKEFVNGQLAPGDYTLRFRVDALPSGTYMVVLETPTARIDEQVNVVK